MNQKTAVMWILGGLSLYAALSGKRFLRVLRPFLAYWEQFRPTPYWDVRQWSWGYGTRVPGSVNDPYKRPVGTITESAAMAALDKYATKDWDYLRALIKTPLRPESWAGLLSFSYNLGPGNADNLVPNINTRNWTALETQWKKYIYVNDVASAHAIERRAAEWKLFKSGLL
ncbi:MAG: hypothetical protein V4721_12390 [Bacteroidota bacterium]